MGFGINGSVPLAGLTTATATPRLNQRTTETSFAFDSDALVVSLRTQMLVRWAAVGGQLATVMIVHFGFGFPLPLTEVALVIAASVLVNVYAHHQGQGRERLSAGAATLYLGFDIIQLAVLISLTGGLANPFSILLLAPMAVAAALLNPRQVAGLVGLTLATLSLLALYHQPLPWHVATGGQAAPVLPELYIAGMWIALVFAAVFIGLYTWRIASDARRMASALSATQLALAREQRISALGAMAGALAHELGSPLSTITLVAGELAREHLPGSAVGDDAALIKAESARCREILSTLSARARGGPGEVAPDALERLTLTDLIEEAAAPHRLGHVDLDIAADTLDSAEPTLPRWPELLHGLGNFLQNAMQFARDRVEVTFSWDAAQVVIIIADNGPGFATPLLTRLGRPDVSDRTDRTGHLGLGVFIATALLSQRGAKLHFDNATTGLGGAEVTVTLARTADIAAATPLAMPDTTHGRIPKGG
jgi:two-component system sensor histidine kinase RegB